MNQITESIPQEFSNVQAPWRVVVLSIVTLGFYNLYWFYRNWEQLKKYKNLDISPGWRTVGLFIPIYNIVIIYKQFRDIRNFAIAAECKAFSSPGYLTFAYVVSYGLVSLVTRYGWGLTDPTKIISVTVLYVFISLSAALLLALVQKTLNAYWEKEQPELRKVSKFTGKETVSLVVGSFWWILILINIFYSL